MSLLVEHFLYLIFCAFRPGFSGMVLAILGDARPSHRYNNAGLGCTFHILLYGALVRIRNTKKTKYKRCNVAPLIVWGKNVPYTLYYSSTGTRVDIVRTLFTSETGNELHRRTKGPAPVLDACGLPPGNVRWSNETT